jgi:SAM-dependent methyltransferase
LAGGPTIDILQDEIEEGFYDFVVARALLHHLSPARKALERMVSALKPGGVFLSIEPDMLPCPVTEPDSMHAFWEGWLKWSVEAEIDYCIGRKIPAWLDSLGLADVAGEGYTAHFNGGSGWARYLSTFALTIRTHYWTCVITFTANWGRKLA